jgi:hypothetical protein
MKKLFFAGAAAVMILLLIQVFSCTNANTPAGPAAAVTPDVNGYYGTSAAGMSFKWKITGADIACKLTGPTTGWISVMLNSSGVMNGADTVIGYVTPPSTVIISRQYGVGHGHTDNSVQDISAVTGSEAAGTTEIDWTMPLTPSDGYAPVQGADMYAILAYGLSDSLTSMHTTYGIKQIKLQ